MTVSNLFWNARMQGCNNQDQNRTLGTLCGHAAPEWKFDDKWLRDSSKQIERAQRLAGILRQSSIGV